MDPTEPITKPLRLWPGVAVAVLLVLAGYVFPLFVPEYAGIGMIAAALCALIIILWWLLFSRARWYERLGGVALMIAAMFPEKYVVHPSIAGGAMGNLSYILVIPTLSLALVGWAVLEMGRACGSERRGDCCRPARVPAMDARFGPAVSRPVENRIFTGGGRRLPRSSCSLRPLTNRNRPRRPPRRRKYPRPRQAPRRSRPSRHRHQPPPIPNQPHPL